MPGLWIDRLAPEAVRIHQGSKTIVVAASPGRLRAEDERMAGDAEAALGSLTWDQEAAGHYPARAAGVPVARAAAQGADGSEASCTSPLRWGGCWSWSGCPATRRSAVGPAPDRRAAAGLRGRRAGSFWGSRRAQERSGVDLPDPAGSARAAAVVRQGAGDGRAGGRCLRLGGGGAGACGRWRRAAPPAPGLAGGRAPDRRLSAASWQSRYGCWRWSAAPRWRGLARR